MAAFDDGTLRQLTRQAEAGNASAQYELGRGYSVGDGTPMDEERARRYFAASAEQKFARSEYELARYYDGQTASMAAKSSPRIWARLSDGSPLRPTPAR